MPRWTVEEKARPDFNQVQPCASGFVLEAHSKSFHSSVQIQWACYVSPALVGWISCFSSLLQRQTGPSEHVHVCACMCVRLWLHSCLKRGNIMYPISPLFHFASRGQLTELPSTFQLFYWAEMFSLAWHIAENPPNYTCHVAWSCPPWQCGLTKWFMHLLSWMDATPLISQNYEQEGASHLPKTINTDISSIMPL